MRFSFSQSSFGGVVAVLVEGILVQLCKTKIIRFFSFRFVARDAAEGLRYEGVVVRMDVLVSRREGYNDGGTVEGRCG